MQTHTTIPRFTTPDGWPLFHLDGVWRDSLAAGLCDLTFDGDDTGPVDHTDDKLVGKLDTIRVVCRIDWIAGPRKGETLSVPMTAVEGMVNIGSHLATGWTLARGIAPDRVTECIEYGINNGPDLDARRFLPDTIDAEQPRSDAQPNLTYRVEAQPT
ncbi:hypothetical protein [Azospirillum canadense]|uniref:hypothetical protein n=1 Tax=Azospirillum canadense TaxID=403962 RepID=UPI002227FE9D|nr:hypothetical protein [Azospirillum canadense]MCW2240743.1 hypothetical protein [Azospirillum canadense]